MPKVKGLETNFERMHDVPCSNEVFPHVFHVQKVKVICTERFSTQSNYSEEGYNWTK